MARLLEVLDLDSRIVQQYRGRREQRFIIDPNRIEGRSSE
jgi:hypothetical protein